MWQRLWDDETMGGKPEAMEPQSLGQYATCARQQHGYSIRQLATRLGVAPSTISRLEDGSRPLPHPDLFIALIDALDLDITTALKLAAPYGRLYTETTRRITGTSAQPPTVRKGEEP